LNSFKILYIRKYTFIKCHSGINATFKPHNIEGNFGLFPIKNEIAKDEKSSYKLIETRNINEAKNGKSLILFKTKNKALKKTMCMNDDEVIANIHTEDDNLFEEIKILLTKKLEINYNLKPSIYKYNLFTN